MKQQTYQVNVSAWISRTVEVQASSPEEARDTGLANVDFSLCHECSRQGDIGDHGHVVVMSADGMTELLDEDV